MTNWTIEFQQFDGDELRDFFDEEPGFRARDRLREWFKNKNCTVFMVICHRPSGRKAQVQVRQWYNPRVFRVNVDKCWRTLERGVFLIKEDMRRQHREEVEQLQGRRAS